MPDLNNLNLTSPAGDSSVDNKKSSYNDDNSCNVRDVRDKTLVMSRTDVQGKDVMVSGIVNSRLEIQGSPSTLHLSNINK